MKYPNIPHDKKRSTKLTLEQIKEIQRDFPNNPNYKLFVEKYNVSQPTIKYWVDEEFRIQKNKKCAERNTKRKEFDLNYKKYMADLTYESRLYNLEHYPEKKIWENNNRKTYYKDNREKELEWRRKYQINNKEKIAKRKKKHYENNKKRIIAQHSEYRKRLKGVFI